MPDVHETVVNSLTRKLPLAGCRAPRHNYGVWADFALTNPA